MQAIIDSPPQSHFALANLLQHLQYEIIYDMQKSVSTKEHNERIFEPSSNKAEDRVGKEADKKDVELGKVRRISRHKINISRTTSATLIMVVTDSLLRLMGCKTDRKLGCVPVNTYGQMCMD